MVSKVKDTEYRHDITGHLAPVHVDGMRVSN
jgi:hypothetical protein